MRLLDRTRKLKSRHSDARYLKDIAFKTNEPDDNGDPKPIDIKSVIALLTAFDRDHYTDSVHPIIVYSSTGACRDHFRDNKESYRKIYPLAQYILELYDHIQEELFYLYREERTQSGEVSRGNFGRLIGISYRDGKLIRQLDFLNKKVKYGIPDGYVLPILGGFRALVEEKNGRYIWGKGLVPKEMLKQGLGIKLAGTIGRIARETQNPTKTGKSASTWDSCYNACRIAYLEAK